MGEGRHKLAGICQSQRLPLSHAEAIAWAMDVLVGCDDEAVSGITLFPADGSEPVHLTAACAKRPPGGRH